MDVVGGVGRGLVRWLAPWTGMARPLSRDDRLRAAAMLVFRLYAVLALLTLGYALDRLVGPVSRPAFSSRHSPGADFGGFYTGSTIAWRGDFVHLGDVETQKRVQAQIQRRERSGWKWFNPLPHPPLLSLLTAPLAALRLREAYWLWVAGSLAAAATAAYLLARTLAPPLALTTTVILLTYDPLWHLLWWGQVDAWLLLPFAAGCVLLLRARSRRDELVAGLLWGSLALLPQFAILPFLALLRPRRWAALGMAAVGGLVTLGSVALVGRQGVEHYLDLARRFGAFSDTDTVTERAMFNLRGVIVRLDLGWSEATLAVASWVGALALAALAIAAAWRALRPGQSPDLALGVIALAMLLTAYHTHRQTMVFLFVLYAAFVGRALRPGTPPWLTVGWVAGVVVMFHVTVDLRVSYPILRYPIQRYLTPVFVALLIGLCVALLVPSLSRRLAGWPWLRPASSEVES